MEHFIASPRPNSSVVAMHKNFRFNRLEWKGKHRYLDELPRPKPGTFKYQGFIKCKLIHHEHYSSIIPDQLLLQAGTRLFWIQPLYFRASMITFAGQTGECHVFVDISHGAKVRVRFAGDGVVARFPDGAILYRCEMEAISGLFAYATGEARLRNSQLQLKLFHHTTEKAARSIEASSEFWTSAWNIQGTKKHADRVFLYLTPLDRIRNMADLQEIAMASSGQVSLRLDGNNSNKPDLVLKVPRESTENRTHALPCWVDSAALAPQHIYRHDHGEGVYYQVAHPFIHRAGAIPGQNIAYTASELVITHPLRPDYVVVGDASTITGLRSPFDEEGPDDIWKIVRPAEDGNFIEYWREKADTRIFDGLPFAPAVFQGSE